MAVRHGLTVDGGLHELGDEVVLPRVLPPVGDLRREEPEQLAAGRDALLRVGVPLFEDGPNPAHELIGPARVDPQQRGDHPHGDLLGVVGADVGPTPGDEAVDQRMAQRTRALLVLAHGPRREEGEDQPASPLVHGRVGGDRRRADIAIGATGRRGRPREHQDVARAEGVDVVREVVERLVGGGQPRTPVAVGVRDRAALAQLGEGRVGVGHEGRIEDVVVGGKVLGGHVRPPCSRPARGSWPPPCERRPRARTGWFPR